MEVRPVSSNKTQFFPSSGRVHTAIWMHQLDADYAYRERALRQLHKDTASYIEQILVGLVSLFYGISTFAGYLMPKSFS